MEGDLAVRARTQTMTRLLELALHALVVVELTVDDDVQALVLVCDRLIAGVQIDDAEPRMPEADAAMRGDPVPAAVRPAMIEALGGSLQRPRVDRIAAGQERDDATHCARVLLQKAWRRPAGAVWIRATRERSAPSLPTGRVRSRAGGGKLWYRSAHGKDDLRLLGAGGGRHRRGARHRQG